MQPRFKLACLRKRDSLGLSKVIARTFLCLLLGSASARGQSPASCLNNLSRLNVAVIGVGKMGTYHLQNYLTLPGVNVVGVFDANYPTAEAIAQKHGVMAFRELNELLAQVDAVSVVTHTSSHQRITQQALDAGVNVLVEKPMSADPVSFATLAQTAAAGGLVLQPGLLERYRFLGLAAQSGNLGPPQFIASHRTNTAPIRDPKTSVIDDLLIHDLDLVLHLMGGPPTEVRVTGKSVGSPTYDRALVTLIFPSGAVAKLHAGRQDLVDTRRLTVASADKHLEFNFLQNTVTVTEDGAVPLHRTGNQANPLREEIVDFIRAVRTGSSPVVTADQGLQVLVVLKKIQESIERK